MVKSLVINYPNTSITFMLLLHMTSDSISRLNTHQEINSNSGYLARS